MLILAKITAMTRSSIVLIAMLLLGAHAFYTGVRYRLGRYKSPYFGRNSLNIYAELGISGGFLFLVLSISSLLTRDIEVSAGVETAVTNLIYLAIILLALNWLSGLFSVSVLRPDWVNWLESQHDRTQIEQLRQQAQAMGLKVWESQVQTQAELEGWITAVLETEHEHPN
jgi:hypothetical protein